jgi:hypothetical protein
LLLPVQSMTLNNCSSLFNCGIQSRNDAQFDLIMVICLQYAVFDPRKIHRLIELKLELEFICDFLFSDSWLSIEFSKHKLLLFFLAPLFLVSFILCYIENERGILSFFILTNAIVLFL